MSPSSLPAMPRFDQDHLGGVFGSEHRLVDTRDVEEAQALTGSMLGHHQLRTIGPAPSLHVTLDRISLGEISFNRLRWQAHITLDPGRLPGYYLISLPTGGKARVCQDGLENYSVRGSSGIGNPSQSFFLEAHKDFDQLLITISRNCIERTWTAMTGRAPKEPIVFEGPIQTGSPAWWSCLGLLQQGVRAAQLPPGSQARTFGEQCLAQGMATALLTLHPHCLASSLVNADPRWAPGYLHRAEAFLKAHLHEPLEIEDVSRHCGVSKRTLFATFKEHHGMGPMRWLKERRLEAARMALSTPTSNRTTVCGVAMAHGFLNQGDFARAYQDRFQELPSETLRLALRPR